ncbi:RluA family pseudouridine synthase [Vineibacter terrae]|nr:RluA family pseudouridine synthase [Vineibacter terrae]
MPRRPPQTEAADLDDDVLPAMPAGPEADTPAPGRHTFAVDGADSGDRLDRRIAAWLPALSRSRGKALIEAGCVERTTPDAARATMADASHKVKAGEVYAITIPPSVAAVPLPQAIPLDILHEDADLLVLDKPAGLVVHPAPGNPDGTLVNALLAHCGDSLSGIGGVRRPGIVHRLDKDTSGVMVAAKNDRAHRSLAAQFARHSVERAYAAVAHGAPLPRAGRIEGNIGRHPRDRQRMAVVPAGGKPAATQYAVLETFGPPIKPIASLIRCVLLTGRTHQVRVHLAHRGHPLVGDPLYAIGRAARSATLPAAARAFPRQALHAQHLAFDHPADGRRMAFEIKIPHDINELIQALRLPS